MSRIIYKVLIDKQEIAIFYELEDAMIFIEGLCKRYDKQFKAGFNFTIKEVLEDDE